MYTYDCSFNCLVSFDIISRRQSEAAECSCCKLLSHEAAFRLYLGPAATAFLGPHEHT